MNDGHQRLSSWLAKYGKDFEIDARLASRPLTDDERRKIAIYSMQVGAWDWDKIADNWTDTVWINDWFDADLLGDWGRNYSALESFLASEEEPEPGDAEPQTDRAEELRALWGVELGQMWRLPSRVAGQEHRLICGDCTDAAVVERVMGGERADMVNIDPPYGVEYSGESQTMYYGNGRKGKERERIAGDENITDALILLKNSLSLFSAKIAFVWCAPQYYPDFLQIIKSCGWSLFSAIVWNKNAASFAAMGATYKPKYEMALACKTSTIPFYGPNNETTVWDFDRLSANKNHPTEKPTPLFSRAISNHTRAGELVADFFLGSGTTLIAAENLSRQCRAVEISPAYVAVALQRYQDAFGITAELVQS
jgi:DNA modification methylase